MRYQNCCGNRQNGIAIYVWLKCHRWALATSHAWTFDPVRIKSMIVQLAYRNWKKVCITHKYHISRVLNRGVFHFDSSKIPEFIFGCSARKPQIHTASQFDNFTRLIVFIRQSFVRQHEHDVQYQ